MWFVVCSFVGVTDGTNAVGWKAIEVFVSGVVCDSEEEAVKVSTRAAHFLQD
jgi:hypothetical protein